MRGHLFKLFHSCLSHHTEKRTRLASANSLEEFYAICKELQDFYKDQVAVFDFDCVKVDDAGIKQLPVWACQPKIRPEYSVPVEQAEHADKKRRIEDVKQERKKVLRLEMIKEKLCKNNCPNVGSASCEFSFCRSCCGKGTGCEFHSKKGGKRKQEEEVKEA